MPHGLLPPHPSRRSDLTKVAPAEFRSPACRLPATAAWLFVAMLFGIVISPVCSAESPNEAGDSPSTTEATTEAELLSNIRQLTFEGRRAGEGYFSRDGQLMVFQSERQADNPFFQIYLLDFATGDVTRVSPGVGKTTCAWIHPNLQHILFASTHDDPQAKAKQEEELALRASGEERRYSWDYDDQYELYRYERDTGKTVRLTHAKGYDAEGSYSPDGSQIVFASNRQAYEGSLSESMAERLKMDPSYFMDLYIMDADGTNVKRLTDVPGYDGGPFFSPDGSHICWRRFSEDGARAEIMTMARDGSDVKQLTHLGAMSWAPFYYPTGDYLIFATNVHGFANFELYMVRADGKGEPVRVTTTEGFDGLPVFTPDGDKLAWTTNRGPGKESQIYIADWNHDRAVELLDVSAAAAADAAQASEAASLSMQATQPDCSPEDILKHVDYLCRPELQGRRTGTLGEKRATAYVAACLDQLGIRPAGDDGTWFQQFTYTSGVSIGTKNELASGERSYQVGQEWSPVSFSNTGEFGPSAVVFAGYGISAPSENGHDEYDSFVHLDVKDKWILCFRFMPESITPEYRQHLARHSSLRFKAMLARDLGARGLILVSGPNSSVREQLIPLRFDGSLSSSTLPIISVTDKVAEAWLQTANKDLQSLQDELDSGGQVMGFELDQVQLSATIDIQQQSRQGRNVLGRMLAGDEPSNQVLVIGAHVDHLGAGMHTSSLARPDEREGIHFGADDNASGVAAMLEIAQWLASAKEKGQLPMKRDILFAAWSGEEDGLIGSSHFVKTYKTSMHNPHSGPHDAANHHDPHQAAAHAADESSNPPAALYPEVAACLNLDMVGRLDKKFILQGVGSSSIWRGEIERRNAVVGLPVTLQDDSYIPTDASIFFTRGVPILSAFTGSHEDYHTPRDTPEKLNYDGAAKIARFMALVARSLVAREQAPDYVAQQGPEQGQQRARLRAYLGTIPDYAESDLKGVKLSGVANGGPAAEAGVQGGDIIVELAGRKIDNIYDYTYAIEALKIGEKTTIKIRRGDEAKTMEITPGSRD